MPEDKNPEQESTQAEAEDVEVVAHSEDELEASESCIINNSEALA